LTVIKFATEDVRRFSIASAVTLLSKEGLTLRNLTRAVSFGIMPALALILFSPVALAGAPWNPGIERLTWVHFVVPMPFYLGFLAAPGYLYSAYWLPSAQTTSSPKRLWIRLSLVFGIVCSVAGMIGTYWMFLFLLPSLPSVGMSGWLLWRFERPPA
jgi:hypothetical protein